MLTIFSTPKPFVDHNKIIQENAIRSWKLLVPECEVILLGNDYGTAEAARQFKCKHIAEVPSSKYGTPLISGLFSCAEHAATNHIVCYVNSDIMFTNTLTESLKLVRNRKRFLLVGQRYNIDFDTHWDFSRSGWDHELQRLVVERGVLNTEYGMDYFIFPKGVFKKIPDLVVGRAWWDNWMIYNARREMIPVIDGTKTILAVHQNHDYSHCSGGKQAVYEDSPETKANKSFVNDGRSYMGTLDAVWVLEPGKVRLASERFRRHIARLSYIYPILGYPKQFLRVFLNKSEPGQKVFSVLKRINSYIFKQG